MRKKPDLSKFKIDDWLRFVEELISLSTTPPMKTGKHKGHGHTDVSKWVQALHVSVQGYIAATSKGKPYDGNMRTAALLGAILVTWYANVHRAKSYDPNRPLAIRRRAARQRREYLRALFEAVNDDTLMAKVWGHQEFNVPHGKAARGGRFV